MWCWGVVSAFLMNVGVFDGKETLHGHNRSMLPLGLLIDIKQ